MTDWLSGVELFWLLGWLVIPMLYGIFIVLPKQYMKGELFSERESIEEITEETIEPETLESDPFTDAYKNKANKQMAKDMYTKEDNESEITKAPRKNDPIYIAIIFVLSVLLVIEYSDQTNGVFITTEEAEKVITECWDERLTYCGEEGLGDKCAYGTMNYCQAKYPDHHDIFISKYVE